MGKVFLCFVVLALLFCSKSKKSGDVAIQLDSSSQFKKIEVKELQDFRLDVFDSLPSEIDGCACYFYLSSEDEVNSRYLFVNDFAELGFISINGKVEEFILDKHEDSQYLYSNSQYHLSVTITEKKDAPDESSIVKGLIKLSRGDKFVEKRFVGTCGC